MRRVKLAFNLLVAFAPCAVVTHPAYGQLNGKPYQQWSAKDAEQLIRNSPWAQTTAQPISVKPVEPLDGSDHTSVTVSLRSALPIREAQARLAQLKSNYDRLDDLNKAKIDAKNKLLLECRECDDYYIVAINPGPGNIDPRFGRLPFDAQSLAWMKNHVEIKNEKGETRELVKFVSAGFKGGEMLLYFSRFNSSHESPISPANHKLTITIYWVILGWDAWKTGNFEFDVARMIQNGKVLL